MRHAQLLRRPPVRGQRRHHHLVLVDLARPAAAGQALPKLLLLDEVTSQLDASNEMLMRSLIREISEQIPVVMVAHRLSTVVDADCVVLMQDGKVRATGSHTTTCSGGTSSTAR